MPYLSDWVSAVCAVAHVMRVEDCDRPEALRQLEAARFDRRLGVSARRDDDPWLTDSKVCRADLLQLWPPEQVQARATAIERIGRAKYGDDWVGELTQCELNLIAASVERQWAAKHAVPHGRAMSAEDARAALVAYSYQTREGMLAQTPLEQRGALMSALDRDDKRHEQYDWAKQRYHQIGGGIEAALASLKDGDAAAEATAPEPEPEAISELKPAPKAEVHRAIKAVYDEKQSKNEKPPNIKEIGPLVKKVLDDAGFTTSLNRIEKLASDPEYKALRRAPGKTLASEKKPRHQ